MHTGGALRAGGALRTGGTEGAWHRRHSVCALRVTSGLVVNSKTYIKYKIFQDFEQKLNDIFSQKLFPKFKTRVSYLALFIKLINIEVSQMVRI